MQGQELYLYLPDPALDVCLVFTLSFPGFQHYVHLKNR